MLGGRNKEISKIAAISCSLPRIVGCTYLKVREMLSEVFKLLRSLYAKSYQNLLRPISLKRWLPDLYYRKWHWLLNPKRLSSDKTVVYEHLFHERGGTSAPRMNHLQNEKSPKPAAFIDFKQSARTHSKL